MMCFYHYKGLMGLSMYTRVLATRYSFPFPRCYLGKRVVHLRKARRRELSGSACVILLR